MKKILGSIVTIIIFEIGLSAQEIPDREKYGNTLNVGAGIGYYGYVGHPLPAILLNYEIDIARNLTLAPLVGVYSYKNYYYWGDPVKPNSDPSYHMYSYRATSIPVGVKGSYYFDQLLHANKKWDLYAAGSIGYIFRNVAWENGYTGDKNVYQIADPLYLEAHIGAEYHIKQKTGIFLDLSTGVSLFGFTAHF